MYILYIYILCLYTYTCNHVYIYIIYIASFFQRENMGDPRNFSPRNDLIISPKAAYLTLYIASKIYRTHPDVFQIHSQKLTNVPWALKSNGWKTRLSFCKANCEFFRSRVVRQDFCSETCAIKARRLSNQGDDIWHPASTEVVCDCVFSLLFPSRKECLDIAAVKDALQILIFITWAFLFKPHPLEQLQDHNLFS